ncbi:MAG: inositol monophosphatase family protein [Patescibacteria group bacterium]
MNEIKSTAEKIVYEAGGLLYDYYHQIKRPIISYKENNEPVTKADLKSSEIICRYLKKHFPKHKILCEEMPGANEYVISNDPTWIIDPLDGTSNFINKLPFFGITLALIENGETVLGIIFDCLHNEMFTAQKGKGATLNNNPICVSVDKKTKSAILLAGKGYKTKDKVRHGEVIFALEQETTYFRRLGSAALMLAYVACGRANAVILTGNQSWDMLAGVLLIKEAGGTVTDYAGNQWVKHSPDLVGTNGHVHKKIVEITKKISKKSTF